MIDLTLRCPVCGDRADMCFKHGDDWKKRSAISDLDAAELEMLGHALRVVPENACLTGKSASRLGGKGFAFFHDIPAFASLWHKVADAINERDDMAEARERRANSQENSDAS